jgi:hypothetical protein
MQTSRRFLCGILALLLFSLLPSHVIAAEQYILRVILPADRTKLGSIELLGLGGVTLAGPFPVYGKADGKTAAKKQNASRFPTKVYGDTPTGGYSVTAVERTGSGSSLSDVAKYGANGALRVNPVSGEAELAKANGRTGLLVHGGALGTTPAGKFLRPTNGCLRMENDHMATLITILEQKQIPLPLVLTVQIGSPSSRLAMLAGLDEDYAAGDPPP